MVCTFIDGFPTKLRLCCLRFARLASTGNSGLEECYLVMQVLVIYAVVVKSKRAATLITGRHFLFY